MRSMNFAGLLPYLAMAAAMAGVGSTVIASKLMAQEPVFLVMLLRFAVATILLLLVVLALRKPLPRLARASWRLLLAQAFVGSVGYSALLLWGLSLTTAADASVITGALPALAALLAVLVLHERISTAGWVAVALASAAMALLNVGGADAARPPGFLLGNALVLAAVACEAVFLLLNKRLREPLDPLWTAALMSGMSLLLCLPVAAMQAAVQATSGPWQGLSPTATWAAIYYAVVPTTLGFWLWYNGSSKVSGAQAGVFTVLLPISGLLLAAGWLGESIETRHWLGMALAVTAIVATTAFGRPPPRPD